MPAEMELTLEQTQQGVSYEVSKDVALKFFKTTIQERYEHVGSEITNPQDGKVSRWQRDCAWLMIQDVTSRFTNDKYKFKDVAVSRTSSTGNVGHYMVFIYVELPVSCDLGQNTVMSDSDESGVTHSEISSPFEDLSDIGSPGVVGPEHEGLSWMLDDPYVQVALQAPPLPDYIPGPEEPQSPPL
ncbi:hypothetical protein Tco_0195421 [Tanacetum coccineum]